MKKILGLILACSLLAGCHSKLDLSDVDTTGKLELGVVMPLGTLRATLGDFLGNGEVDRVSVDRKGLFHFIDTVEIPKKTYHHINIADYIIKNEHTLEFPIAEKLPIGMTSPIHPSDYTIPLVFDLELGLQGFNRDTTDERIDSIWVTEATFVSNIGKTADFGLNWDEIERVELVLGEQFTRSEKTINIPVNGKNFNTDIPIKVTDFSLNVMKDKNNPRLGMVDKIKFQIKFYVKPNHDVEFTDESKFNYSLHVNVIDYSAIWGFFEAGNDTRDARMINMDSLWKDWKKLKNLKMRFAKPSVTLYVTHHIAAPLRMHVEELYAIDSMGNKVWATWDGEKSTTFDLKKSLSPHVSTMGDSIQNSELFNENPSKGHIDELFDVRPDSFYYAFNMLVDRNYRADYPWNQHRITKDSTITGYAIIDIPFAFKEGSSAEYETDIKDVDLSKASLDSIADEIERIDSVKEGSAKIGIHVKNYIPFVMNGHFTFFDKNGQKMDLQFLDSDTANTICIKAPEISKPATEDSYGTVTKPSENDFVFKVNKDDLSKLSEVKTIHMKAELKDNPQRCTVDSTAAMTVKLAVAAKLEAVFNFNNKK